MQSFSSNSSQKSPDRTSGHLLRRDDFGNLQKSIRKQKENAQIIYLGHYESNGILFMV
jgi:hypothetical protein